MPAVYLPASLLSRSVPAAAAQQAATPKQTPIKFPSCSAGAEEFDTPLRSRPLHNWEAHLAGQSQLLPIATTRPQHRNFAHAELIGRHDLAELKVS